MPTVMPQQLDIFEHSRDVMLHNDVLQALERRNAALARAAWQRLAQEYPQQQQSNELLILITLLEAQSHPTTESAKPGDHQAVRQARLHLQQTIAPAALTVFGKTDAHRWLRPFWQDLAQRAAFLPFCAGQEHEHAAPMLLHLQDWPRAIDAIAGIASWRRIPAPLAWMALAKLQQFGLQAASWPLLAELAWLASGRFDELIDQAGNPILQRMKETFDLEFDEAAPNPLGPAPSAWFPAWVLTHNAALAPDLALAQRCQHNAPEQAMRLLLEMLGLERQGRQHEAVAKRKTLGELHPLLLKCFLKAR